jgi:hypothetical protein
MITSHYIYVFPDKEWFEKIKRGWDQFRIDLDAYEQTETAEKPKAEAIMKLPALNVQIKGEIISTNLPLFSEQANDYLDKVNIVLVTDQDFANAEAQAKECREIAKTLEVSKKSALSQTASIDELLRTVDFYKEKFNQVGLKLEKLVKSEKETIKAKIATSATASYNAHIKSLQDEIIGVTLIVTKPDFSEAMKAKRTLASLQDAVNTELANAKINADAIARDIRLKLTIYNDKAAGYVALFADLQTIIYKPIDDFKLLVETRVSDFDRAQKAREEQAVLFAKRQEEEQKAREEQAEKQRAAVDAEKQMDVVYAEIAEDIPEPLKKQDDELALSKRPSDIEIIGVLMVHFKMTHMQVIERLREFGKDT